MSTLIAPLASDAGELPFRFVATSAGFTPPVVGVDPGQTVRWLSLDTYHVLISAASICNNGAEVPVSCNIPASPGTLAPLPIHPDAVEGRYFFTCSLHSNMAGFIVIGDPVSLPPA